tara:strand:+ start:313 stop:1278 length:966 start_codon:yes stop_codon:yes gene_type:complete
MITIKNFTATDKEFIELVRIYNLVNHDSISHVDDARNSWKNRNESLISNKLLMYKNNILVGNINYYQGRDGNIRTAFYSLNLDPNYNNNGYRELLYNKMLQDVKTFNCNKLHTTIYEHPNYNRNKKLLIKKDFKLVQTNREYSCDISKIDLMKYKTLIERLESEGIKLYNSKYEMRDWPNHYKKLEKLCWTYGQDIPMPKGIDREREPFDEFLKDQSNYEKNYYAAEIIAVKNNKYIASTDLEFYPKAEPQKAWTGSLGVLKEYRRKGIAVALKIRAFEELIKKGITEVRTDNEKNNPMYKINLALGFKSVPFSLDYIKEI